jgi:DNA-binding beta-propeller fold protein YncE
MKHLVVGLATFAVLGSAVLFGGAGQGAKTPAFHPVPNAFRLPEDFTFGGVTGLATDAEDRLYVFHRAKKPIAVFDRDGTFLRGWGDENVKTAHGIRIDRDGNIWTTDLGTHEVIKYDPTGKVLLRLGTKNTPGESPQHFNKPADIAFAPNGDVYVADGYGNSRVAQFDKTGKFLRAWGKKGKGEGEFNLPHALVYDVTTDRLYVGDRENKRVQIFDPKGTFLGQWRNTGHPYGLFLHQAKQFFVACGPSSDVRQMDLEGMVLARWGTKGMDAGQFELPHGICVDSRGVLYVAEVAGKRVQKFVAK